jgi:hypothetical protein
MAGETFADRHCIMRLGPSTGHVVTPIAFCRNDGIAEELVSSLNSNATLQSEIAFLKGELERLEKALREARECLDGQPEYHHSGMGCGLEDRNIRDRYQAMEHGWECAMDRVYGEHINGAVELIDAALQTGGPGNV